jgi:hypothetical protein
MKKLAIVLFAAAVAALYGWDYYWAFDLVPGTSRRAIIDHHFLAGAYTITWTIQLGYLVWLGLKWRSQQRNAAREDRQPR